MAFLKKDYIELFEFEMSQKLWKKTKKNKTKTKQKPNK